MSYTPSVNPVLLQFDVTIKAVIVLGDMLLQDRSEQEMEAPITTLRDEMDSLLSHLTAPNFTTRIVYDLVSDCVSHSSVLTGSDILDEIYIKLNDARRLYTTNILWGDK